jgi:alpha-L-fucosidase
MTMTQSWGHSFEPEYKSARQLIHTLVDVVSKGGNFLLNIGPTPEGLWQQEAYDRLEEIGKWIDVNGEAIYNSKPIAPYKEGKVCFTSNKEKNIIYATYLADKDETKPPSEIHIRNLDSFIKNKVAFMGSERHIDFIKTGKGLTIEIPKSIREEPPCNHAWTIKIKK